MKPKVQRWFSAIVDECQANGQRFLKAEARKRAVERFPEISPHWFEQHVWAPMAPRNWTGRGRPKGSRNTKGKNTKR